jgi:biofilm PGA synthesis N-glycosyltransferase PgaC
LATVPYAVGPFRPDVFSRITAKGHVGVKAKFAAALLLALAWLTFSIWVSRPWLSDLGALTHPIFANVALTFIAYVPGFMNAFLLCSLVLDRRPKRRSPARYPGVTIIIAAYQEQGEIGATLESLAFVDYPGEIEILVLNDGSTDGTAAEVR